MEKTVKIRAYPDDVKNDVAQGNLTEEQNKALELVNKNAQLDDEKKKSLEYLKVIEQLKESLKQEQAKTAEMSKKLAGPGANDLAVKEAQLEEEKSRSLENLKTIVQLRESLKQEQAKAAELAKNTGELEAKIKGYSSSEASELAKRTAQLEEEKKNSIEQMKVIDQLKESLKQEQAKTAGIAGKTADLEAKAAELFEALNKISNIASAVKAD